MELIKQRKSTDCGVACAAMLAGVSYEEAKAAFGKKRGRTNDTAMYLALRKLGLKVTLPMVGGKPNGRNALLKCNRTERRVARVKHWHWCAWDAEAQRILDPLDDGKTRPILAHMPAPQAE